MFADAILASAVLAADSFCNQQLMLSRDVRSGTPTTVNADIGHTVCLFQ